MPAEVAEADGRCLPAVECAAGLDGLAAASSGRGGRRRCLIATVGLFPEGVQSAVGDPFDRGLGLSRIRCSPRRRGRSTPAKRRPRRPARAFHHRVYHTAQEAGEVIRSKPAWPCRQLLSRWRCGPDSGREFTAHGHRLGSPNQRRRPGRRDPRIYDV